MGIQELCVNWATIKSTQSIVNLLQDRVEDIRAWTPYNKLEKKNTGLKQRGGTATLLHNQLAGFTRDKEVDHTGLSRWSWLLVEEQPRHQTIIISVYAPFRNESSGLVTVFQ